MPPSPPLAQFVATSSSESLRIQGDRPGDRVLAHLRLLATPRYQVYNVFNEVQFTNLNAAFTFTGTNNSVINSANTGKYVATGTGLAAGTIAPRVMGLTVRMAW